MKRKNLLAVLAVIAAAPLVFGISPLMAAETGSAPAGAADADQAAPAGPSEDGISAAAPGDIILDYRLPGSVLRPRGSDVGYTPTAGGGCIYANAGSNTSRVWNVPVYLPQGATIKALRMYYDDTSATNSTAWFTVYDLYGTNVQEWSVNSVGDYGNGFNDSSAIDHTIDYTMYNYTINWRPAVDGSAMQLCGFRIFYTPDPSQNRTVIFPIAVPQQ